MTTLELWQNGVIVASAESESPADACREICHYASVYAQDGQVMIKAKDDAGWRELCSVLSERFRVVERVK